MDVASFPMGGFGIILAILALCVCVVWLIFPFIAMNRLRGIRRELERSNRHLANFSSGSIPTISSSSRARARIVPTARVISPPSVVPLKISRDGKEHSLKDTTSIKIMLKRGELTLQDRYYDRKRNEWVTLDCHPEICQ
jgi:hypothetical protein